MDRKTKHLQAFPTAFFFKEGKRPLRVALVGPAKHLGRSVMETVAGLIRPPRHTLHRKKSKAGAQYEKAWNSQPPGFLTFF
jgi:hypothetical protein